MKRPILSLAYCLSTLVPALAQPAPDFTVTDSDGQVHHLYQDYLDQGKTVLIEIFFTDCPPCNSIAPLMQPLYEDWGEGEFDVEFFELSNKSYDDNENINNFKWLFGITFPSVGSEGGSLDAVQPYQNGTYGPFYGTPTFIVIAPDGSVNYHVHGPNNQGTIDAIDDALEATGAMKPEDPPVPDSLVIQGEAQLYYETTGIANVEAVIYDINDPENILASDMTNSNGEFTFTIDTSGLDFSQYAITVSKGSDPSNGVSAGDLFIIQRHILTLDTLDTPQLLLASDGNGNGNVTTLDLVRFIKIILGLTPNFSDDQSWLFYSAAGSLNAPEDLPSLQSVPLEIALDPEINIIFKGIKKGDVNNTVDPLE